MTDPSHGNAAPAAAPQFWRLVFCDPEPLDPAASSWLERFFDAALRALKPGYRHCFLMRRAAGQRGTPSGWLIVNPNSARMDIFDVADTQNTGLGGDGGYGAYLDRLAKAGRVSVLDVPQLYPATLALRPWFSCVEVAKHVTGLKPPVWVVTPWQLYRWIRREGIAAF